MRAFIRRIILGLCVISFTISTGYLLYTYVYQPIKYKKTNEDTSAVDTSDRTELNSGTSVNNDVKPLEKYSALLSVNPDFVGKLYVPALDENRFNIVQCDDNSTYLTTGFKGDYSIYGTLFVDYRNDIKNLNTNTIIYGHKMRDGSQLGLLNLYADIKNYKDYPVIEFDTIYKDLSWKIFAAFLINSEKEEDNGYVFPYLTTVFPSEKKFSEFIDDVKSRSYFINDSVEVLPNDKILTLSTCNSAFNEARFVVMARLVRDGESKDVDVSGAHVNENQRFPDAYYEINGMSNPFENTSKFSLY